MFKMLRFAIHFNIKFITFMLLTKTWKYQVLQNESSLKQIHISLKDIPAKGFFRLDRNENYLEVQFLNQNMKTSLFDFSIIRIKKERKPFDVSNSGKMGFIPVIRKFND